MNEIFVHKCLTIFVTLLFNCFYCEIVFCDLSFIMYVVVKVIFQIQEQFVDCNLCIIVL